MPQPMDGDGTHRRSALCVGIGTYTHLDRILRYAAADATAIAGRLADPQRGNFAVTVLTTPEETTKAALEEAVKHLLSAPGRQANDLTLLYFSCHGVINQSDKTFLLLPSNAFPRVKGGFRPTTVISVYDLARWFKNARTQNIVVLLDVCHSGGAGAALQHFPLNLDAGPNYFFIGAARQDQDTKQSSKLKHGWFTNCLLRAFDQPPTADGWLTISQIHTFVSDEIKWFTKDQPAPIQSSAVSVNPNLPLLRNPQYPELSPLPPLWNVPFSRNIFFTGQDDLLSQLENMLQHEQKTALTQPRALSGLGGIGKTQLALEYAYRHRQDYHAVLWGNAEKRETLISTFVNMAHLLDLPEKDDQDQTVIVEAVKAWLKERSHWLFILDNVEDLALAEEFLPPAFGGHLLLTTRTQIMGGIVKSSLEVKEMPPEMGAQCLLYCARMLKKGVRLEDAPEDVVIKAKELSEELGGLPLALDQAGAYIDETQCGLSGYQSLYQAKRAWLLANRGSMRGTRPGDHSDSVVTTLSLSFAKVEATNPMAADMLRLCAFLDPVAIPEELLTTETGKQVDTQAPPGAADAYQLNQAVASLRAYSLVSRNAQEQVLSVHRLVQAVLQDLLSPEERRLWTERAILAVNAAFPNVEYESWVQCERLLVQALEAAKQMEQYHVGELKASRLLYETAIYLQKRARYAEAEPLFQQAISIREQHLGPDDPLVASPLNALGELYREQGRYTEAEPLYRRALSIREQQLGPEHPDVALSLNDLAALFYHQGKYVEAEPLFRQALSIWEQQLGPEHRHLASPLNDLANIYTEQDNYREAELLYRRALSIWERQLGPEHPDVVPALNNLANLLYQVGKYTEAERLFQRALTISEHSLGPEHPLVAYPVHNLAEFYREQGRHVEAEPFYQRALSISEQQLGTEHPFTAYPLSGLANLYREQGRYVEAEPLYQRALSIWEKQLGTEHLETAATIHDFAIFHEVQGHYQEALVRYRHALAIREQVLGTHHADTIETHKRLIDLLRIMEQHEKAVQLEAAQSEQRISGEEQ